MSANQQMPANRDRDETSNGNASDEERKSLLTQEIEQMNQAVAEGKEAFRNLSNEAREEIKKPTTGAAIAGAAVVGAAAIWGAAEAAVGAAAAYIVYRILKRQGPSAT
jgi:hypothetical protein